MEIKQETIVSIIANTSSRSEVYGFILPLTKIPEIKQVRVFGEGQLTEHSKVRYYPDSFKEHRILRLFSRLANSFYFSRNSSFLVGIYEIPHGVIAFLVGLLLRKRTVLCIIGNPAYKKLRRGLRMFILNILIRKMSIITVTGSNSRDYLIRMGYDPTKIFVLPNSINIDLFYPIKCEKKYDLISLGRISPEKELINFLKIIGHLKKQFPQLRAGIAGTGPELTTLKEFAYAEGLEENVNFLGYVEDKINFYRSGKIFVLTSSTEGLPRTVIESMACGIPCVASNVGDMPDIIIDKVNGFLVEDFNNLQAYVNGVSELLNSDSLRLEFSNRGVDHVRTNYSHDAATRFWQQNLRIN